MHNAAAFLIADGIVGGLTLTHQTTLQYLFILSQIPVSMAPTTHKALYDVKKEPFYKYFIRGMNLTLSTGNPLHTHYTKEPLIEEYANVAKTFNLTASDITELARNSVKASSFLSSMKGEWIGNFEKTGRDGNDSSKTNVPDVRIDFRNKVLEDELNWFKQFLNED
ncbi:AMP deaminase [Entamoeba marina]